MCNHRNPTTQYCKLFSSCRHLSCAASSKQLIHNTLYIHRLPKHCRREW